MTQLRHARPLCPHLAAAALWTSKSKTISRRGTRTSYGRAYPGLDDLLAL